MIVETSPRARRDTAEKSRTHLLPIDVVPYAIAVRYGILPLAVRANGVVVECGNDRIDVDALTREIGMPVVVDLKKDERWRASLKEQQLYAYTFGADRRAVSRLRPPIAVACDALPLRLEDGLEPTLVVAIANEDVERRSLVSANVRMKVRFELVNVTAIRAAIRLAYRLDEILELRGRRRQRPAARQKIDDLITECYEEGGQCLLVEGTLTGGRVRFGIDGHKYPRYEYTAAEFDVLMTSIFNIAVGKGSEEAIGEGKFEVKTPLRTIHARVVSFVADFTGREAVVRLFDTDTQPMTFTEAGLTGKPREQLDKALAQHTTGVFVFVGPGESGKSMSAFALMRTRPLETMKVIGIGDPPEFYVPFLSQIRVTEQRPYDHVLGAILRASADGMVPGEVRRLEDMVRVFDAAQTGGLHAMTTHADDPFVAINRLSKGVDRTTLAGIIRAVIGQRLLRRLCIVCRMESHTELPDGRTQRYEVRRNTDGTLGCEACAWMGYSGRVGVFEVLRVNRAIALAIERGCGPVQLSELARKYGYRTLLEDALDKCVDGVTDLNEVKHVLAIEEDDSLPEDLVL